MADKAMILLSRTTAIRWWSVDRAIGVLAVVPLIVEMAENNGEASRITKRHEDVLFPAALLRSRRAS